MIRTFIFFFLFLVSLITIAIISSYIGFEAFVTLILAFFVTEHLLDILES